MKRPPAIGKRTPPPNRPPDYSLQWEDYCIIRNEEPPRGAFSVGDTVWFQPEPENTHDRTAVRFVNQRGVRGGYLYRSNEKEAIFDALGRGAVVTGTVKEYNKWGMAGSVDIWVPTIPGFYNPRELRGIGPAIVAARSRAGMTQADLAGRLRISTQKLSAMENTKTFYYPAELIRDIASLTGTTPEELGCRDVAQAQTVTQSAAVRTSPASPAPSAGRVQPIPRQQTEASAGPAVGNRLTIRRESAAAYAARRVRVLIDGTEVTALGNRASCVTELPTGSHTVELAIGRKTIGAQQVNIAASVDVTLRFTITAMGAAAISVTQISTGPVEPGTWVPTQPAGSGDVFQEQRRSNGALWGIMAAIVIIWLLWFVLSNLQITFTLVPVVG